MRVTVPSSSLVTYTAPAQDMHDVRGVAPDLARDVEVVVRLEQQRAPAANDAPRAR